MSDIAQCLVSSCPKAKECYRFMAIPNEWQSYMEFQNICKESNDWQWFYVIDGKPVRELIEEKEGD